MEVFEHGGALGRGEEGEGTGCLGIERVSQWVLMSCFEVFRCGFGIAANGQRAEARARGSTRMFGSGVCLHGLQDHGS